jgi:serine O-acetyltransferase
MADLWHPPIRRYERVTARLIRAQQRAGVVGRLARWAMLARGTDIHPEAKLGPGVMFPHAAAGVIIHACATLGREVVIFAGVTIGRADPWRPSPDFAGFVIGDHAMLCAGAVILGRGRDRLTIGEGAVIGANAVITSSVPPWEIWAGNPARKVGERAR